MSIGLVGVIAKGGMYGAATTARRRVRPTARIGPSERPDGADTDRLRQLEFLLVAGDWCPGLGWCDGGHKSLHYECTSVSP